MDTQHLAASRPHRNLQTIPDFEDANPAFAGRMRWIRWRSDKVRRTRPGNGSDVVVEDLEPNGFATAFVKVAGRVYVDVDEFWRLVNSSNGPGNDVS